LSRWHQITPGRDEEQRLPARLSAALHAGGVGAAWLAAIALLFALALSACGKRNLPVPPPDEEVTYPRQYPRI
jgi:hypothetical protein